MSIILALGPIFIIFALFKPTKGFTQSWVQHLVNFALIPIVTSSIIALMYSTISNTLGNLKPSSSVEANFDAMASYSLVASVAFFLLFQVLPICSALAGGVILTGIESGMRTAYSALKGRSNSGSRSGSGDKLGNKSEKLKSGNSSYRSRRRAKIQKMRQ